MFRKTLLLLVVALALLLGTRTVGAGSFKGRELPDFNVQEALTGRELSLSDLRGKGLYIGMEIDPALATAREVCERLMKKGLLSKETHETVVRFAPPLIVNREQLAWASDQIRDVLADMDRVAKAS